MSGGAPWVVRWTTRLMGLALGCVLLLLVVLAGVDHLATRPGPATAPVTLDLERGLGVRAIARRLAEVGAIDDPRLFEALVRLGGVDGALKAGEYAIPAGSSLRAVIAMLEAGRVVQYTLTVPEGWTVAEVMAAVAADPVLEGELPTPPGEGRLLPETYVFARGATRAGLVAEMREALDQALTEAWANRAEDLPMASPEEALILASIVEKETGVPDERDLVAGVFVNRLRRNMPLQTDPTVIYAITRGVAPLGRGLTRRDLEVDDPYNTYRNRGLPPGPIANPGRASIQAAVLPAETDYLYFVADGSGGHAFARTLDEHNANVRAWRAIEHDRSQEQGG